MDCYFELFFWIRHTSSISLCVFVSGAHSLWSGGAWRSPLDRNMLPKSSTPRSFLPEVRQAKRAHKHAHKHTMYTYGNTHSTQAKKNMPQVSLSYVWMSCEHRCPWKRLWGSEREQVYVWVRDRQAHRGRDSSGFWLITFSVRAQKKTTNMSSKCCSCVCPLALFVLRGTVRVLLPLCYSYLSFSSYVNVCHMQPGVCMCVCVRACFCMRVHVFRIDSGLWLVLSSQGQISCEADPVLSHPSL